jgi:hypothetical protein
VPAFREQTGYVPSDEPGGPGHQRGFHAAFKPLLFT